MMALVVRNTFFHVSRHSEDENALGCARRTRSTPPPTTEEAHFFEKFDDGSASGGWITDCSTAASEDENEIDVEAVVCSGYETDDGCDELFLSYRDCPTGGMSPDCGAAAPQFALESKVSLQRQPIEPPPPVLSWAPIQISPVNTSHAGPPSWTRANLAEDEIEIGAEAEVSSGYETDDGSDELFFSNHDFPKVAMSLGDVAAAPRFARESKVSQQHQPVEPPPPVLTWASTRTCPVNTSRVGLSSWSRTNLDSKARPFKIFGTNLDSKAPPFNKSPTPNSEVDTVLLATKQILVSSPCVETVAITLGTGGTVATLAVQLAKSWQSPVGRRNAATIAKSALMDTTYSSQNVYILGYETQPFEELPEGSGFAFALALLPAAWYNSACWETYQNGCCPRSTKCKWKHPGRDEIRPVRVVLS